MTPLTGNVYWADLPYEEHLQSGLRPVVVLQNNKGNQYGPHVHVVPLTGQMHKAHILPTHVVLKPNKQNGLRKNSVALAENLRPIPKQNIMSHIGVLNDEELASIGQAVKLHLKIG